ncbi:MAG: pyruvate kinase [Fimbriimonas sp.]
MKRRTKIVCTLGPATDSRHKIGELIEAGMNVARINCSHGDWETRRQWIEWIRAQSPNVGPVAILADLQGPKFRIGQMPPEGLELRAGQTVTVGQAEDAMIPVRQSEIVQAMHPNGRLLMGDGEIELRLGGSVSPGTFEAKVVTGGCLSSRKGVTLVGKAFDVAALTDKDREDVREAVAAGVDFIALSYVKSAHDIRELRRMVDDLGARHIGLCAKIEMRQGIRELEEILKVVDLVMVARGDMGLQMDIEDVPLMQKHIIDECTFAGKPVITATQMLESMIEVPRPTRAEATDVANAVLDGTDALMLSGETAMGKYPIECVRTMVRIAVAAEANYDRHRIERNFEERARGGVRHTDAIAHAVSELAHLIKPKAIVCTTTSGQTPQLVSKFRPKAPILCTTWNDATHRKLAVVWGVESVRIDLPDSTDAIARDAVDALLTRKRIRIGDTVIITAGVPAGTAGNTNLILTQVVK